MRTHLRLLPVALALSRPAAGDFGDPLRGLSADELRRFSEGRMAFETVEGVADGLGPVFNGTSCAGCHRVGGSGGGSQGLGTPFGRRTNGVFDPPADRGGSPLQSQGIVPQPACTFVGEQVPAEATIVARRRTTPLFGLGLVDAVPDAMLVALADRQVRLQPETAGRPNIVTDITTGQVAVGKFGWKSQVPNLLQFAADAYLNEMGITTALFPNENCPQGDCSLLACDPVPGVDDDNLDDVELFRDFMSFLAPPPSLGGAYRRLRDFTRPLDPWPRPSRSYARYQGSHLFEQTGCANCHLRSLTSGASAVAALQFRTFHPYSDFLLHDMGSLGDGIEQGQATGREMRTAPLWGLRLFTTFLHDGRATTIEGAILAHDGQGRAARDRFVALAEEEKAKLVAFVRRL